MRVVQYTVCHMDNHLCHIVQNNICPNLHIHHNMTHNMSHIFRLPYNQLYLQNRRYKATQHNIDIQSPKMYCNIPLFHHILVLHRIYQIHILFHFLLLLYIHSINQLVLVLVDRYNQLVLVLRLVCLY